MTMILPAKLEGSNRPTWLDKPELVVSHGVQPVISDDSLWTDKLSPDAAMAGATKENQLNLLECIVDEAVWRVDNDPHSSLMTDYFKMLAVARLVADMCVGIQPLTIGGE